MQPVISKTYLFDWFIMSNGYNFRLSGFSFSNDQLKKLTYCNPPYYISVYSLPFQSSLFLHLQAQGYYKCDFSFVLLHHSCTCTLTKLSNRSNRHPQLEKYKHSNLLRIKVFVTWEDFVRCEKKVQCKSANKVPLKRHSQNSETPIQRYARSREGRSSKIVQQLFHTIKYKFYCQLPMGAFQRQWFKKILKIL